MGYRDHQQQSSSLSHGSIRCGIITISDTRTSETDTSGAKIRALLTQASHDVVKYEVIRDEPQDIVELLRSCEREGCQVIITNGGTGIARRDSTFEAVDGLLEKRLPGFGELFRMLSYQDIGSGAMLSRATAGIFGRAIIFALPGSTGAVQLAMEKLILPELSHLVWELVR